MADENFENLIQSQLPIQAEAENTEMVSTETAEQEVATETEESSTEVNTEMVNTEVEAETTTNTEDQSASAPEVDYNEWLKTQSEGLFENTESFKGSLEKFKDYDAKVAKVTELEKNQLPDDPFVKTLTKMRSEGASKDQITEFIKLNTEFEDFSSMTPEQVKVAKLVLIDGYSKDVATRKVNREFDMTDFDEGSDEWLDAKEELRISSKKDLNDLESYKAKISTIENNLEKEKLEQVALKSAHEQTVRQQIPAILDRFSGIGDLELAGTLGKEDLTSTLKFDFDDDFKKQVPVMLEKYFNQSIEPITENSIKEASDYIKATYLVNNWEKLAKDIYKNALALAHEKTEQKYVNPKGVEEKTKDTPAKNAAFDAEWKAFEEKFASMR